LARIRSVKPELRTSLTAAEWPREVRYFWVLLWGYLDDHGRGVDEPRLIKADCFPLDDDLTADIIDKWLAILEESGSICRYTVGGRRYLHAPQWREHQKPQHATDSRIPPCDGSTALEASCGSHEVLMSPHESLSGNAIRNTPSTNPPARGRGDVDGDVDGEGVSPDERGDVTRICSHLADSIEANGSKRPKVTKDWRDAARLMLDRDGRTEQQVHTAIDWCQSDEFWRSNVLSMPTLRKQYDKLRLQAQRGRGRHPPEISQSTGGDRAQQVIAAASRLQDKIDRGEVAL
jgi:hypothetical protein